MTSSSGHLSSGEARTARGFSKLRAARAQAETGVGYIVALLLLGSDQDFKTGNGSGVSSSTSYLSWTCSGSNILLCPLRPNLGIGRWCRAGAGTTNPRLQPVSPYEPGVWWSLMGYPKYRRGLSASTPWSISRGSHSRPIPRGRPWNWATAPRTRVVQYGSPGLRASTWPSGQAASTLSSALMVRHWSCQLGSDAPMTRPGHPGLL